MVDRVPPHVDDEAELWNRGRSWWITACSSPTAVTGRPASNCWPGATTVTRSATAGSASAICARTASIVHTGASVAAGDRRRGGRRARG